MADQATLDDWARSHHHSKDPETSRDAALSARELASKHRELVFKAIQFKPMTGDEVADWAGLELYQARRRISDLHNERMIMDSGERRLSKARREAVVWKKARAASRAEGIANIKLVNGIQFYVTADAYRAAREEAGDDWPYGADSDWGKEAGVNQSQVSALCRLYEADINALITCSSWQAARDAIKGLAPVDGRSAKSVVDVTVDGEAKEGELQSPSDEDTGLGFDEEGEVEAEPFNKRPRKVRVFFEMAHSMATSLEIMDEAKELPPLTQTEIAETAAYIKEARLHLSSLNHKLKGMTSDV